MTPCFMDRGEPFGFIDDRVFNMDGACEILAFLGIEEGRFEE